MKLAVIPARGGSKRIPGKNIKLFAGQPIISYSIEAAINSQLFDRVIVSTDDNDIANVAKKYGAEVPFKRPEALSNDFVGTNEVVKHAIEWLHDHNQAITYACCIYATAPFVLTKYLREGYERLSSSEKSFAFSVTSYSFPIERALHIQEQSTIVPAFPESILARSQDLEEYYHDVGQFYWGTADAYINNLDLFSSNSIPVIIPRYLAQDIDTLEDWRRAELMYKALDLKQMDNITC